MTVRRYATLWCEWSITGPLGPIGCGNWTEGDGAYERVRELRAAAKRLGWRRVDGKEHLPQSRPWHFPNPGRMIMTLTKRWRTGHHGLLREIPEMIFEVSGGNSAEDRFVGMLASEELARHAVEIHNESLRRAVARPKLPESPVQPHERWQIMLQPDSLLAIFDVQDSRFVLTDASPGQVLDMVRAWANTATDYETRGVLIALTERGETPYPHPVSWRTAMALDREHGGDVWKRYEQERVDLPNPHPVAEALGLTPELLGYTNDEGQTDAAQS